jgi:hypothetical protein
MTERKRQHDDDDDEPKRRARAEAREDPAPRDERDAREGEEESGPPAGGSIDLNAPSVRVRLLSKGDLGAGDERHPVQAGTYVRVSVEEATALVQAGQGIMAPYGEAEATHGASDEAQALQAQSDANARAAAEASRGAAPPKRANVPVRSRYDRKR